MSSPPDTATAASAGPTGPHARVVLTVASLGFFLITLDISIVNVALSRIRTELGGGTTGQQWVIDVCTVAALLGQPLGGLLTTIDWPWWPAWRSCRRPCSRSQRTCPAGR